MHMYKHTFTQVHPYTYKYTYMYIYMHVHTHIYIYIYISQHVDLPNINALCLGGLTDLVSLKIERITHPLPVKLVGSPGGGRKLSSSHAA